MITKDRLKLFKTEEEIRQYAKVNGYDEGGTNLLVESWKKANTKTIFSTPIINTYSDTVGTITDIEEK